jgi:hypothetical protein
MHHTFYPLPSKLQRFQITKQIGHLLRIGLKLRHWGRIAAGYLFDEAVGRFAFRNFAETRADTTASIETMTTATVDLKDRMS